jgi:hypothetical protein
MVGPQFLRFEAKEATEIILKNLRSGWKIIPALNAKLESIDALSAGMI